MPGSIGRGRLALRDVMGASSGPNSPFRLGASRSSGARRKRGAGSRTAAGSRFGSNCTGIKFHPHSRKTART